MWRNFSLSLGVGAVLLFGGPAAQACSCREPESAAAQLAGADAAFRGRVVAQRSVQAAGSGADSRVVDTTFKVLERWRGELGDRVTVRHITGDGGSICGVEIPRGPTVTVFTFRQQGRLWTGSCSHPAFSDEAYRRVVRGR